MHIFKIRSLFNLWFSQTFLIFLELLEDYLTNPFAINHLSLFFFNKIITH